ncbi:hypothetical protein PENTCL1PPCAC_3365, partial [Pristionchus entomophagus]
YWNDVARLTKCDGITMKYYEFLGSGQLYDETLFNGDIMNGQLFSSIEPLYFLENDPRNYTYTMPAAYYKMMFLEKNPLGETAQVASISFFIVFPLDVLILFILSCKLIDFLDWSITKCRARKLDGVPGPIEVILNFSDFCRFALFSFSIVFLVQQWQGYFNGNNLLPIMVEGTSFPSMVAQFHEHKRQLVVDSFDSIFGDEDSSIIFAGNSSFIYGSSVKERFELTCDD